MYGTMPYYRGDGLSVNSKNNENKEHRYDKNIGTFSRYDKVSMGSRNKRKHVFGDEVHLYT